jgi:biopolymer transport protein ExbD
MYAANELAVGFLLCLAGALAVSAPPLKRALLRTRIGVALILIAAGIYGGWEWWMATRTWVPLDMPVSLAQGHVRSPEFKINLEAGFWIFIEVETKVDDDGVSCLTGFASDYCSKNGVRELHASWTLSDAGRIVARGSTNSCNGSLGGMVTKGCGLGEFSVPAGKHFILDVNFPEDDSHFDGGHPRLRVEQSYSWRFEENRTLVVLFAIFLGAIAAVFLVSGIVENGNRKRAERRVLFTSPGPLLAGFRWEFEPADWKASPERRPFFRARVLIGLGLAMMGTVTFAAVTRWLDTRIFVPVDIPVSLAAGHLRTGPFRINVEQGYSIWIDFDQRTYFNPMCSSYSLLKTTWTLYRDGRVYAKWDAPVLQDAYLEGFGATKGVYDLDVHVLADASCLNVNRPRLRVVTSRDDDSFYAGVLLWMTATFAAIGITLVILSWRGGVFSELERSAVITNPPIVGQNFQWAQKLRLRRPIEGIPPFGLLAGTVFALFAILMMTLTGAFQYQSKGLWVHLLKPGAMPVKPDAWAEPLIVLVKDAGPGQEPRLCVNSKVVAWDDFASALKHELSGRREWTVYVEGEDRMPWADVASVIDIARGDGAKVFLVRQPEKAPRKNVCREESPK